ncbi:MAG: HEAT repeat domain-containing protein [Acidobacteriota bacterium]
MDTATPGTDESGRQTLLSALRDLAFAVKALQLYPATSPVVRDAVTRAHTALLPFLRRAPITFGVLPQSLQTLDAEIGGNSRTIRHLAERLHQRGVSHMHFDSSLAPPTLQRLAELLATNRDKLLEDGGINTFLQNERLPGIALDMLRLERLYEDEDEDSTASGGDSAWEMLLKGYGREADLDGIDWQGLASDPQKLERFLRWLLGNEGDQTALANLSRVNLVRAVCEKVGTAAAAMGGEALDQVAAVIAHFYDQLDREVWIDLLTDPIVVAGTRNDPAPSEKPGGAAQDTEKGSDRFSAEEMTEIVASVANIDLGQRLACSLAPEQIEDLLIYGLTTRHESSPRIFQLFQRVLEKRSDRDFMAQAIRETVERQIQTNGSHSDFSKLWPQLSDALQSESPDPYVSRTYRASLDQLLLDDLPASLWPLELLQPRMRELDPVYLLQRKSKILVEVLEQEKDDDEYCLFSTELERTLPEFIVQGQYIATEEILTALASHLAPSGGRSVQQRQAARDILLRFCNQHTLREVVRNLAGKPRTQIDAATRIFQSLGPMAVPALLEALSQEGSRPIRLHLVRMLAALGDKALDEIQKHLRDQRWFFVRNLVWIIGEIGDQGFVRHLGLIANHDDVRVRREAVRALAKLRGDRAVEQLQAVLQDPDFEVTMLAVRGLGQSGSRSAVGSLSDLLQLPNLRGQNTDIIQAAAVALGKIGDPAALSRLRRLARKPLLFRSRRMKATEAARWAISAIHGEAVADDLPEGFAGDATGPRSGSATALTGEDENGATADTAAA